MKMTTDELNTKVLKLLIEHLKDEKLEDRNTEWIRENSEWFLNLIGVAYISVIFNEEFNPRDAWRFEDGPELCTPKTNYIGGAFDKDSI